MDQPEREALFLDMHERACNLLHRIYATKNLAYGDSAWMTYIKEGDAAWRVRLTDKLNRYCNITTNPDIPEGDESVLDTLLDLANYALMAYVYTAAHYNICIPEKAFNKEKT